MSGTEEVFTGLKKTKITILNSITHYNITDYYDDMPNIRLRSSFDKNFMVYYGVFKLVEFFYLFFCYW